MKKIYIFITFLLLISVTAKSQQINKEKIKLLKVSYITDAINLTPSEAEKFWPVYNLHMNKIKHLKFSSEMGLQREILSKGGVDSISQEEAEEFVRRYLKYQKEIYSIKNELFESLLKILPPKRILKLQKAERDFNRRMLQEYGKRKRLQMQ